LETTAEFMRGDEIVHSGESMCICGLHACIAPVSPLNNVVLPAPFTPSNPKHSPGRMPNVKLDTATTSSGPVDGGADAVVLMLLL
jgi:hypothetical protein